MAGQEDLGPLHTGHGAHKEHGMDMTTDVGGIQTNHTLHINIGSLGHHTIGAPHFRA